MSELPTVLLRKPARTDETEIVGDIDDGRALAAVAELATRRVQLACQEVLLRSHSEHISEASLERSGADPEIGCEVLHSETTPEVGVDQRAGPTYQSIVLIPARSKPGLRRGTVGVRGGQEIEHVPAQRAGGILSHDGGSLEPISIEIRIESSPEVGGSRRGQTQLALLRIHLVGKNMFAQQAFSLDQIVGDIDLDGGPAGGQNSLVILPGVENAERVGQRSGTVPHRIETLCGSQHESRPSFTDRKEVEQGVADLKPSEVHPFQGDPIVPDGRQPVVHLHIVRHKRDLFADRLEFLNVVEDVVCLWVHHPLQPICSLADSGMASAAATDCADIGVDKPAVIDCCRFLYTTPLQTRGSLVIEIETRTQCEMSDIERVTSNVNIKAF